ncbi:aldo/keto reductase [Frondihabitans australicus]|uniref:Aryl-alcohol dehydrogenase-like predicted oxidoreductase n=1 Tax=Frondihabitans australicus TaxID=386892 RepID=A0A495IKK3_9MICO|nr:aldo/keto reductase [Frondihabitans australicus]RKR75676.1 aryl-alcohol dehydrogenase-like predicted oxidoreductase [Frondihabitans australicus]
MQTRTLGTQGLATSAIGYGAMGITSAYGAADEQGGIAAIRRAHDLGVTMFDTAELYGMGTGSNEQIVGRAIAPFRDEVTVATKFGWVLPLNPAKLYDSRPEHIREVADASLRYLGVDTLDVFYQHRVDPDVPIEDVAGTVGELVAEGKVKYFGLSEAAPDTIRRAHAVHPVSVLQSEFSIFERATAADVLPTTRDLGIGFVAYSPLGRGFLTGDVKPAAEYAADDMRSTDPRWQPGNYEKNLAAIAALRELAATKGVTVTQLALAWLLAQGDDVIAIPGTRSVSRVEENTASADVELSDGDLARIDEIVPDGAFGARYVDLVMPVG